MGHEQTANLSINASGVTVDWDEILRLKEQIARTQHELEEPMRLAREHVVQLDATAQLTKLPTLAADTQRAIDELRFNVGSVGNSIVRMLDSANLSSDITDLLPKSSTAVAEAIKATSRSLTPEYWEAFGLPALTDAAGFNSTLINSLAAAPWQSFTGIDVALEDALVGLSGSYADVFASLERDGKLVTAVPDFVIKLPPRDMVLKTEIVASRSVDYDPDRSTIDFDDPAYARGDVDEMLADLDLGYVSMLDEAFETMASNTIGRARHTCNSIRELCMHVLHHLSPDDEVKRWNADPDLYGKDGRPHRRLRVMYVCRFINNGGFTAYLNKTISLHVAFFDTLNELHAVRPNLTNFQLRLMLTEAIGILRFLLRTATHKP